MTESSSSNNWVKGCAIVGGVVALLSCCGFGIFAFACGGLMDAGQDTQLQVISASLHAATPGHPRAAEYETELGRFDAMRPNVSFLTFGVLNNRFEAARRDDGTIDAAELDHLMELVTDIDNSGGNVDLNRYPGGT
ncbi:MAG: hypothetical protein J0L92_13935 [Deltaproteobacteria bacterium]|nr:hypothetical protein [Deltaproteobacteria bacterium]